METATLNAVRASLQIDLSNEPFGNSCEDELLCRTEDGALQ